MTAPGLRRCPRCGYIAELHGTSGFADCDMPASLIPFEVNLPDDDVIRPVATADAVLAQPDKPVSVQQAYTDYLLGRLTRSQYDAIMRTALLALAVLQPDAPPRGRDEWDPIGEYWYRKEAAS